MLDVSKYNFIDFSKAGQSSPLIYPPDSDISGSLERDGMEFISNQYASVVEQICGAWNDEEVSKPDFLVNLIIYLRTALLVEQYVKNEIESTKTGVDEILNSEPSNETKETLVYSVNMIKNVRTQFTETYTNVKNTLNTFENNLTTDSKNSFVNECVEAGIIENTSEQKTNLLTIITYDIYELKDAIYRAIEKISETIVYMERAVKTLNGESPDTVVDDFVIDPEMIDVINDKQNNIPNDGNNPIIRKEKYMAILTSNPDYVTLKTNMNTAIKNFVKNNPNSVKYSTTDAGKSVITLFFGEARDVELKDLAKICMETLNDADFVIEGIPVTVVKSSESYLVFEGEKAAVETAIKRKANDYPILVIATNQTENFDLDQMVADIKNNVIDTLVEHRSDVFSYIFDPAGIKIDENSVTGRVIVNIDYLNRYINKLDEEGIVVPNRLDDDETNDDDEEPHEGYLNVVKVALIAIRDTVLPILRLKRKNKALLNTTFVEKLAAQNLGLERVNEDSVTFTYAIEVYSEDKKVDPNSNEPYFLTRDSKPSIDKTYYIKNGEEYEECSSDSYFDIFEEDTLVDVYEPTKDDNYVDGKTYYVEEAGGYRVTTNNDYVLGDEDSRSFKSGVTYYEHSTTPGDTIRERRFKAGVQYYEARA